MKDRPLDADVIIVGSGPSGLTVAGELAMAGAKVIVLERRTGPVQSRAGTILPRVLELLDARGLADAFIQRARAIRENPFFQTHIWAGMQPVHWRYLKSRWGFRLILPQNITEELLREHAEAHGVTIRNGNTMQALTQDADGVTLDVETPDGPATTLRAKWVIGADGGRSAVREAVGIPFEGRNATFTGIVADVKFDFPWAEGRRMVDNDKGWVTSFPFGETEPLTRFNMVHAERRHAPASEPVTEAEVRQCLRDILEIDVPFEDLRWASRFSDTLRIARRFREGRVLLVGESNRVHYPSSGVGMNFCVQDAFNLGWKLGAVIAGHASAALLDSYEAERMQVARALLESVQSQCGIQFNFTEDGIAFKRMFQQHMLPLPEVNSRIAHELNGLTSPYPAPAGSHMMTGARVPDLDLVTPVGDRRIGELLRDQHFLLIDLTGGDAYGTMALDGLPVTAVNGVPVLVPSSLDGMRSLLVRPDAYIAWVDGGVPSVEAARAELERWLTIAA